MLTAILVVAVSGIWVFLFAKCGPRTRTTLLVLAVLCIGVVAWFLGGREGSDRWISLTAVATFLVVIVALLSDEIQKAVHRPKVAVHIGMDLIDIAHDFDAAEFAQWIRGTITNIGDRGAERCRLKLLKVEGENVPTEVGKVENGFLQWQGGIRD
jgi:hypothetical protein